MLAWIKKRVRMYEAYEFSREDDLPMSRRLIISVSIEDYQWMVGGGTKLVLPQLIK